MSVIDLDLVTVLMRLTELGLDDLFPAISSAAADLALEAAQMRDDAAANRWCLASETIDAVILHHQEKAADRIPAVMAVELSWIR